MSADHGDAATRFLNFFMSHERRTFTIDFFVTHEPGAMLLRADVSHFSPTGSPPLFRIRQRVRLLTDPAPDPTDLDEYLFDEVYRRIPAGDYEPGATYDLPETGSDDERFIKYPYEEQEELVREVQSQTGSLFDPSTLLHAFETIEFYKWIAVMDTSADTGDGTNLPQWTHVRSDQGFSLQLHNAAFVIPHPGLGLFVEVHRASAVELFPGAVRAILVPIIIGPPGKVEVTTFNDGPYFDITPGNYGLLFEAGIFTDGHPEPEPGNLLDITHDLPMWIRLTFIDQPITEAAILRQDPELNPRFPLVTDPAPEN